jgi:lipopolysaccharide export system protein LptC
MTKIDTQTMPPTTAPAAAGGFSAVMSRRPAPHGGRIFAPGYSRFVSLSKMILPAIALLLIVMVVVWPRMKVKDTRFRLGFAAITAGEADNPSMVNPRFMSADKDSQTFLVTADIAKNLLKGKATVQLEMPKADILLGDGTWLVMTAESGIFARAKKALDLSGSVDLFHDSGYEFRTEKARVDLARGIASGESPISGQGPFGEIEGQGFVLDKNRKSILFTGKSSVTIFPGVRKQTK